MEKNNMKKNKIFKMYEEASFFFKQGDFEQALTKFSQVISEGGMVVVQMMI
jgi:shikimate kinase